MDIVELINNQSTGAFTTASQGTSELGKEDFLSLLVTQLKNQDPFEPMENGEFISQLAEFSSLEQAEKTSQSLSDLADLQYQSFQLQSLSEGSALIGKNVTYFNPETESELSGEVTGLEVVEGRVTLKVNDHFVPLSYLTKVNDTTGGGE